MYFTIKITRDEEGVITSRDVTQKSSEPNLPRGGEYLSIKGDKNLSLKNAKVKVEIAEGREYLSIIEDPAKKALSDSEEEIELRLRRMDFGKRLIAIMSIRSDEKELNTGQVVQLNKDFSDINAAVLNGSISTAKALISFFAPDGTIITQSDKDALLSEINNNETDLGY